MEPRKVTFCQSDLPGISFAALEDMRVKGELCDLIIRVQGCTIVAHRAIVAAGIPYFRSHFMSPATENEEIALDDLDPAALKALIHFAYISKVEISDENVESLLVASELLQLIKVREACLEFLSEGLCVNNVFEVRTLAQRLNNMKLTEISNRFMINNFEEFSVTNDFLKLSHSVVKQIISQDDLDVCKEEIVFEAVMNWAKNSSCERQEVLPELLSEVRMIHLPIDFLMTRVVSEELIKASKTCCALIDEVKNYHVLPKRTSLFPNVKTAPRKWGRRKQYLYAICQHWQLGFRASVFRSDFIHKMWEGVASHIMGTSDNILSAVLVNEKIYMFREETIQTLHTTTLQWEVLKPKRGSFLGSAILSFGNRIYCFGSGETRFLDKVRCFDVDKSVWLDEDTMKTIRYFASAALMEEYIYVLGGIYRQYMNTAEKFNPTTGLWTRTASMLIPRSRHASTSMKGKIYVCGGRNNGNTVLSSAEVYDPLTDQWNAISCMGSGKHPFSLISYGDMLYALGGINSKDEFQCDVEIYDPVADQWNSWFDAPTGLRFGLLVPGKSS